jgi:hypothetical protein
MNNLSLATHCRVMAWIHFGFAGIFFLSALISTIMLSNPLLIASGCSAAATLALCAAFAFRWNAARLCRNARDDQSRGAPDLGEREALETGKNNAHDNR